jgi:hypothetical protein
MGASFNLWDLNTDQDFHEEGPTMTEEELMGRQAGPLMVPELVQDDGV